MSNYNPKGWWAVIKREFMLMRSRRTYLMVTLILPVIAIGVMTLMFINGVPRNLPIGLVDMNSSATSRKLARMIDAVPSATIVSNYSDLTEAKRAIERGDIYGVVIIPQDFEKNLFKASQPQVAFFYNNAYMIVGGIINKDVTTAVSTFSAGVDLNLRLKKGQHYNQAVQQVMPVKVDSHALFNPYTNYFYYLTTAFLPIMLLMFILSGTVYAIGSEFKYHTADEWLKTAHGSIIRALSAKMTPYLIIYSFLMLFVNVLLIKFFGTPFNGSVWLLVYNALLFVLAYISMGIVIISIFTSLRMALSISSVYAALAFTMSGLTFPHIAMYKAVMVLGYLFPFTHYHKVFIGQALQGAPVYSSLHSLLLLNLFLILPFFFLRRMKKICNTPKLWGRD
ncbi:MAG TPA: ABC transporter permease [Tenuifilaceae bacterium]|nr:ABC transporter permease [Tenuifilaceae bacterium]HPI44803.1 ABC transporter permease [Tenuifilaceae bacterium]HPN22388.1 ABC transporter permease [Tenuifilaceae bacterium]HPV55829.1 ABC transporter permease [Tenuifilaceae bacterium]